jgi:predicted Zn-ribbon and HTH transcriptional regulator
LCEGAKKFQNTWTTKLPWAKSMWEKKGEVHHVQCKECTFVEGKQKLLIPKLDNLLKTKAIENPQFSAQG